MLLYIKRHNLINKTVSSILACNAAVGKKGHNNLGFSLLVTMTKFIVAIGLPMVTTGLSPNWQFSMTFAKDSNW